MTRNVWLIAYAALAIVALPGGPHILAASLAEQREAFRVAYAAAERGSWNESAAAAATLSDYPLWPDLRATYLRASLATVDAADVVAFLEANPTLRATRELRYRLALKLGADRRYPEFLSIYDRYYRDLQVVRLDCLALLAGAAANPPASMLPRGLDIWLNGTSQPDECDPVFAALKASGQIDTDAYRRRYELAVAAREFRLARNLARSVDPALLEEGNRWLAAAGDPDAFLRGADVSRTSPAYLEQIEYAIRRLALTDPDAAAMHWDRLAGAFPFRERQSNAVLRDVALWSARNGLPDARDRLAALPAPAVDAETLRWRVRAALRDADWTAVASGIAGLPAADRDADEWRYWSAMAWRSSGHEETARPLFAELAAGRGYYGFLAADAVETEYCYGDSPLAPDELVIERLGADPALVRARELYLVGLESAGRSEWDAVMDRLGDAEQRQAAILAGRWGWHSRAIATAARSGSTDDLVLRYPLPYRDAIRKAATTAGLAESWVYGIARSESLFMTDIRSPSGAIGLMQLLPETGRRAALALGEPYAGWDTLVDPQANIRFGTHYLGMMRTRFSGNVVLATAAYNAGPLRVEQWVPDLGTVDARIWVENIPYDETRSYVRRVLESATIFHWRLTGQTLRLSRQLDPVMAATTNR